MRQHWYRGAKMSTMSFVLPKLWWLQWWDLDGGVGAMVGRWFGFCGFGSF